MLLLALDTATPAVTAALHDGDRVLAEETTVDARRHGELLTPAVQTVLRRAGASPGDLTAIVAGAGPGPYTGLRVGLVTAQALATVAGVPAYGLCTLDALAYQAVRDGTPPGGPFVVATDARRKEVFYAVYTADAVRTEGPFVGKPPEVPDGLPVVGAGGRLYAEVLGPERITGPEYPAAGALAALAARRLAEGGALPPPRPIYLRRPDAQIPGRPKKVTA